MKNFLGIIAIGLLSILCIIVSFHTFQMSDYSLFRHWWRVEDTFDNILLGSSWIISTLLVAFLCWKILKRITVDYRYHFIYWAIVITLFILPFVTNRGWYWFQIGFFIGLPASGFNYLVFGIKSQTHSIHKKLSYLILLAVFLVGGYDEYKATNSAEFSTTAYHFEVNTYTIPTFLDWEIEGEIEIEDKKTGKDFEFDFWYGNGPYFYICKSPLSDTTLYLKGFKYNGGHDWIIDLKNDKIESYYSDDIEDLQIIAVHDSDFELRKE